MSTDTCRANVFETERPPSRWGRLSGQYWIVGLLASLCIASVFVVLPWDLTLSRWAQHLTMPGDLKKFINLCEAFAHGTGSAAIVASLLWIDTKNRRKLWLVAAMTAASGIIANAAKYIIPRNRPYTINDSDSLGSWDTWGTPLTQSWFDETVRSFPSGHTATAIALAIGLSFVYPRGRVIFAVIAILASLQRLVAGAHYASDILASILIATLVCVPILHRWGGSHDSCNRDQSSFHC